MDYLRTAYTTRMKLWADRDDLTEVRWYRCEDTAEDYPRHRYSSRDWEADKTRPSDVGEQPGRPRRYYKGQNWLDASGQGSCGDPAVAERGGEYSRDPKFPTDEIGWSACCRDRRPFVGHLDVVLVFAQVVPVDGGDVVAEGGLDVFTLTVQGYNSPIDVLAVETLQFDDTAGPFIVNEQLPGVARVRLHSANANQPGVVDNALQHWYGEKRFLNDVWMGDNLFFGAWGLAARGGIRNAGGSALSVSATDGTNAAEIQLGGPSRSIYLQGRDGAGVVVTPEISIGNPAGGGLTRCGTATVAGLDFREGLYLGGTLVVPPGAGGTGQTGPFPNGSLLIGNGSTWGLGTITPGSGITVTNGPGTVSIGATVGSFASVSKWSITP